MAGFKTLNSADPSVRRPLRVSDLQDLWDGLGTIFAGVPENTVKVVSGFELGDNNTVLEGVLIYNHKLYYYGGGLATLGNTIYLYDVPSDQRVFADGQTRDFSFLNVATVAGIYDDGLVAVELTREFISDKLVGAINDGAVTTPKLADLAVTTDKIATQAIDTRCIQAGVSAKFDSGTIFPTQGQVITAEARDSYKHVVISSNILCRVNVTPVSQRAVTHDFLFRNSSDTARTITIIAKNVATAEEVSKEFSVPASSKTLLTVICTITDVIPYVTQL